MRLYDVPRESYVKIIDEEIKLPVGNYLKEVEEESSIILFFDHIDGMYSYCKDVDGNLVHPAAWTEVVIVSEEAFKHQSV
jgi:hypothetical protein